MDRLPFPNRRILQLFVLTLVYQYAFCCKKVGDDLVCEYTLEVEALLPMTIGDTRYTTVCQGEGENEKCRLCPENNRNCPKDQEKSFNDVMTLDGVFREAIGVNGQVPGPTLLAMAGAQVVVHVTNKLLHQGLTIHMHGQHQKFMPYQDGVPFITECPLMPGQSHTYRFKAEPSGTYWYHAHTVGMRTEGLYGALVVLPYTELHKDLYDYRPPEPENIQLPPYERLLLMQDWMHQPYSELKEMHHRGHDEHSPREEETMHLAHTVDGTGIGHVPYVSGLVTGGDLIGGRMRFNSKDQTDAKKGDAHAPYQTYTVSRGSRYRFRMIGVQMLYAYKLSIDDHDLKVISSDGSDIKPVDVDSVIIDPGERYDIVLSADQPDDCYWIRMETLKRYQSEHGMGQGMDMDHGTGTRTGGMEEGRMGHGMGGGMRRRKPRHAGHGKGKMDSAGDGSDQVFNFSTAPPDVAFAILKYTNGTCMPKSTPRRCTTNENPCLVLNCPFPQYPAGDNRKCISIADVQAALPPKDNEPKGALTPENVQQIFFNLDSRMHGLATMNGIEFSFPSSPLYPRTWTDIRSKGVSCADTCGNQKSCKCTHIVPLKYQQVYQIVLTNAGQAGCRDCNMMHGQSHPMHMHGHSFHVLKMGYADVDKNGRFLKANQDFCCPDDDGKCNGGSSTMMGQMQCNNPKWTHSEWTKNGSLVQGLNLIDPPRKDTVSVPFGGYVVLRINASNPGVWIFHCHNELHEGMAMLLDEASDQQRALYVPPGAGKCAGTKVTSQQYYKALECGQNGGDDCLGAGND